MAFKHCKPNLAHLCYIIMKNLEIHEIDVSTSLPLQYADEGIHAGFPSPAPPCLPFHYLHQKLIYSIIPWYNISHYYGNHNYISSL